jgi:hypothetical protein
LNFLRQCAWLQEVIAADADDLSGREPLDFFWLLRFCFFFKATLRAGAYFNRESVGFKVAVVEVRIRRSDVEIDRFIHLTAIN